MAENDENAKPQGNAEEPASKKGGLGRWLLILGILVVFLAIEIGLAVYFVNKLKPEDPALKALKEEQELDQRRKEQMTSMGVTLEEPIVVMVNIAGTNGERFLKAAVQLEYSSESTLLAPAIEERMPKVKNIIIDILSSRPMAELLSVEGKKNIRNAIVADVNMVLPDQIDDQEVGKIQRCFFEEFVIQ